MSKTIGGCPVQRIIRDDDIEEYLCSWCSRFSVMQELIDTVAAEVACEPVGPLKTDNHGWMYYDYARVTIVRHSESATDPIPA